MIFVHVVKVSVVKIVDVAIVPDCGVAAVRTMLMGMVGMMFLGASHDFFSFADAGLEILPAPIDCLRASGQVVE